MINTEHETILLTIPICQTHKKPKRPSPGYGQGYVCPECREDIDRIVKELEDLNNTEADV